MLPYHLPQPAFDLSALPAPIRPDEPGSFAAYTIHERMPLAVAEARTHNHFPDSINLAINALRQEVISGDWRPLAENTPDRKLWNTLVEPYVGQSLYAMPFILCESFIYRRLLEATRYFQPGPWLGFDVFLAKKQQEWAADRAPAFAADLLAGLPSDPATRFRRLLHGTIWGNRMDLSFAAVAAKGRDTEIGDESQSLLINHEEALWQYLSARPRSLIWVCDNAGSELITDLVFVDHVLSFDLCSEVAVHVKPQPFFVSDTTLPDVLTALLALESAGEQAAAVAHRLRGRLATGRLRLVPHWFYATALCYYQMPLDLHDQMKSADLVLLKGDLNYRRLVGDVHWDPASPLTQAAGYFPSPVGALRILKSELITGLQPGEAERLDGVDPQWLFDGRWGILQCLLPNT